MIWFSLHLWHTNHCWLFNAKSSLYIYIKYIWFGLVGFSVISTIVGYLMPNPLLTYIYIYIYIYIYMIWFGWVFCHINHYRLFNAKSSLYIYIKYMWFALFEFYGISTIVGYLVLNHFYTNISKVGDRSRGWPEGPFSMTTIQRCRGGRYSFPWIVQLYPWYVPHNAEC